MQKIDRKTIFAKTIRWFTFFIFVDWILEEIFHFIFIRYLVPIFGIDLICYWCCLPLAKYQTTHSMTFCFSFFALPHTHYYWKTDYLLLKRWTMYIVHTMNVPIHLHDIYRFDWHATEWQEKMLRKWKIHSNAMQKIWREKILKICIRSLCTLHGYLSMHLNRKGLYSNLIWFCPGCSVHIQSLAIEWCLSFSRTNKFSK